METTAPLQEIEWSILEGSSLKASLSGYELVLQPVAGILEITAVDYHARPLRVNVSDFVLGSPVVRKDCRNPCVTSRLRSYRAFGFGAGA
jgi:hypothetical protein